MYLHFRLDAVCELVPRFALVNTAQKYAAQQVREIANRELHKSGAEYIKETTKVLLHLSLANFFI